MIMTVMVMVLVLNGNNDGDSDDNWMKFMLQKGTSPVLQDKEEFCLTLISVKFTTRIAIVYCRM